MDERDQVDRSLDDDRSPDNLGHWEMFAEATDLTIEGHRLIAEEVVYELKLLWRGASTWFRDVTGIVARHRPSPPA